MYAVDATCLSFYLVDYTSLLRVGTTCLTRMMLLILYKIVGTTSFISFSKLEMLMLLFSPVDATIYLILTLAVLYIQKDS